LLPWLVVGAVLTKRLRASSMRLLLPCAITVVAAIVLVTRLGPLPSPYVWIAAHVDAVRAFRAPGRIAYMLLPVQACVLGLVVRELAARSLRGRVVAVVMLAAAVVEGVGFRQVEFSFDKAEARRRIGPLVAWVAHGRPGEPFAVTAPSPPAGGLDPMHLDAFAVALATGRPAVNGYSGTEPGWVHVFRANPTVSHLDRALIEMKVPAGSVEVVPLDAVLGAPGGLDATLRLPSRAPGRYRWGDEVDFGPEGTGGEFVVDGLDPSPAEWRWTLGHRAAFHFVVEPSDRDRELVFEGLPLIGGPVRAQRVGVVANGVPVATLELSRPSREEQRVTIPAAVLRGRTALDLAFDLPGAHSPAELGINDDRRVLALALRRMRIE